MASVSRGSLAYRGSDETPRHVPSDLFFSVVTLLRESRQAKSDVIPICLERIPLGGMDMALAFIRGYRSENGLIHLQDHHACGRVFLMAHTLRHKKKLIARVRRIRGQVESVERALDEELECVQVLQRITACRGAIDSLLGEVLEDHVRFHIIDKRRHRDADPRDAGKEILDVIRMYLR